MELLKILLITAMISGCAHTLSNSELEDIPDFESLVGSGELHQYGPSIKDNNEKAILSFNKHFKVSGRDNCEALILTSLKETVLTVAKCSEESGYEICGRAKNECIIEFDTKKSGSSLFLINDGEYVDEDVRHIVNFHTNKIVYKIQGQSCLIPYPHGCIIDGFSWVDRYTYSYIY
jgi:hypothetical protein